MAGGDGKTNAFAEMGESAYSVSLRRGDKISSIGARHVACDRRRRRSEMWPGREAVGPVAGGRGGAQAGMAPRLIAQDASKRWHVGR